MASPSEEQTSLLIERLAASRDSLGRELLDLRRRLDVPARVKDSIVSKPMAWFGGSLGVGLLASLVLKRPRASAAPRPERPRRGWMGLLLGGAVTLARPALQSWALRELQNRFVIPRNDNVRKS
jgi:hypothetical protein